MFLKSIAVFVLGIVSDIANCHKQLKICVLTFVQESLLVL